MIGCNTAKFRALPGPVRFPKPPEWVMYTQALSEPVLVTSDVRKVTGGNGRGADPGMRRNVMSIRWVKCCLLTAACAGLVGMTASGSNAQDKPKDAAAGTQPGAGAAAGSGAAAAPLTSAPGVGCPPVAAPAYTTVRTYEWVAEHVPVTRTVMRNETRNETYTAYRYENVNETKTRNVTVMKQVCETVMETRTVKTTRPITETVMETKTIRERFR